MKRWSLGQIAAPLKPCVAQDVAPAGRWVAGGVAIAALVVAGGCAAPEPAAPTNFCMVMQADGRGSSGPALVGQQYGVQHAPIPLNSVQFDTSGTAKRVAVQGLYAARTPADTVRVDARFVNCVNATQTIRARISFMRENQSPAEPTSAWKVVHLPPQAIGHYSEFSTARDVSSYLIEVGAE